MIAPEFVQFLNLLEDSPSFVIRIDEKSQKGTVSNPASVSDGDGNYLIHGTTIAACGAEITSVFSVNTNAGGEISAIYWKTSNGWMDNQDPTALKALDFAQSEMYPFDWAFSVPLDNDIFHQ